MFWTGMLLLLATQSFVAYYSTLPGFDVDATMAAVHWVSVLVLYCGVGGWMGRRRPRPGGWRASGGAFLGAAIGFGIPFFLGGFEGFWNRGLSPITIMMLEVPILICSTIFCGVFHPWLPKPAPGAIPGRACLVPWVACLGMFCGIVFFTRVYSSTGLRPGDIYCPVASDGTTQHRDGIWLVTLRGREVTGPPSTAQGLSLGPSELQLQIAVLAPTGETLRKTGSHGGFGATRAVREGSMTFESDLPGSVPTTLTYTYDGRTERAEIQKQAYSLSDGKRFVVSPAADGSCRVLRANDARDVLAEQSRFAELPIGFFD